MARVLGGLLRAVVALVSTALLAAVGFGWVTYRTATEDVVRDDVIAGGPVRAARDLPRTSQTILLVGLDSRTDAQGNPLPRDVLDALRAGEATGEQNTDTMMVVHIPADPAKKAFALSLPRDSYVDIAGDFGMHKLNSAYARGRNAADGSATAGRRTLIETVSALTGLTIDHYAEINLVGFSELTSAVGGVPVCLVAPVSDSYSGAEFPAGHQVLQGIDALKFVRQRHGLPNGDLDRVRRQQAFLAGLANQLFSSGTLTSPGRITELVDALTRSVVLDQNWDILAFATQVASLTGDDIAFSTIPTGRIDLPTPSDGSAVEVSPEQVRAYVQSLLTGPPPSLTSSSPAGSDERKVVVRKLSQESPEAPITAGGVPCVN